MSVKAAVIQAGGKGSRLRQLTEDKIPKPMINLCQKPMIAWQLEQLLSVGVERVYIIIGHLGEQVSAFFGDGANFGVHIEYIKEDAATPLGSAGSLFYLKDKIKEDFFLIFGDVMFNMDLSRMIAFHREKNALGTLLVHPNSHPYDSDVLILDNDSQVVDILHKNQPRESFYKNRVNAGFYLFSADILNQIKEPAKLDLEKDLLLPLFGTGKLYGYSSTEYVKDAGTPERFFEVSAAWENKTAEALNLKNKQRAIFLDRDGTINVEVGLIYEAEPLRLEERAAEAIKMINASPYLALVLTNQPVVARGLCSINEVENIHAKLETLLGDEGAYVDDIIFCPHHPDKGFPEENPLYKIPCNCRKPATGMIDAMVEKYNLDLSQCYLIGDRTVDIKTAENANIKSVLVKTGAAGLDGKCEATPTHVAEDLLQAVEWILNDKLEE